LRVLTPHPRPCTFRPASQVGLSKRLIQEGCQCNSFHERSGIAPIPSFRFLLHSWPAPPSLLSFPPLATLSVERVVSHTFSPHSCRIGKGEPRPARLPGRSPPFSSRSRLSLSSFFFPRPSSVGLTPVTSPLNSFVRTAGCPTADSCQSPAPSTADGGAVESRECGPGISAMPTRHAIV
jgi:hypothetical protein